MRKLDRAAVPAPPCLAKYRHGRDTWDKVDGKTDRAEIRAHLERVQGKRCAYCEGDTEALGHHIEHFRTRSGHPKLTFEWSNLFLSCDKDDSCGRYKDGRAGPYDVDDLLNPCDDDPDRFFRFRSDGSIDVRPGLSAGEQKRATETLRVFNLSAAHGRLRSMRRRALEAFLARDPDILSALETFAPEERRQLIEEELARTARDPFGTIIRHFFEDMR